MNPIKQILQFAGVGVVNTGIDLVLYFVFTRLAGMPPLTASLLSFFTGSLNSFLMNKHWTFAHPARGPEMARQYLKSLLVACVVLSVHQISLLALYQQLGLSDILAKVVGVALGMTLGFILNRRWVFRLNLSLTGTLYER